jgi:hypothetical protein
MIRSKNDLRRFRNWVRKVENDAKDRGFKITKTPDGVMTTHPDGRIVMVKYSTKGRSAGQRKRHREFLKKNKLILNSLDRIEAQVDKALKILGNWS